jgi:hypothetical protein
MQSHVCEITNVTLSVCFIYMLRSKTLTLINESEKGKQKQKERIQVERYDPYTVRIWIVYRAMNSDSPKSVLYAFRGLFCRYAVTYDSNGRSFTSEKRLVTGTLKHLCMILIPTLNLCFSASWCTDGNIGQKGKSHAENWKL